MKSKIVHPQLMQSLPYIFNSLCAIHHYKETTNEYNEVIVTYEADRDMAGILCYKEPISGSEVRNQLDTTQMSNFVAALQGYYPKIVVTDQAVIDGIPFNIQRVTHDDTNTATFLTLEVVNAAEE